MIDFISFRNGFINVSHRNSMAASFRAACPQIAEILCSSFIVIADWERNLRHNARAIRAFTAIVCFAFVRYWRFQILRIYWVAWSPLLFSTSLRTLRFNGMMNRRDDSSLYLNSNDYQINAFKNRSVTRDFQYFAHRSRSIAIYYIIGYERFRCCLNYFDDIGANAFQHI